MTIIGIDSGKTGGIAIVCDGRLIAACPVPYLKQPIQRVWLDGGKHPTRFTINLINSVAVRSFVMRHSEMADGTVVAYVEEPAPSFPGKSHAGSDAAINRSFQSVCQAMHDILECQVYAVNAVHWPGRLFKAVPRGVVDAGGTFPAGKLDKKDRARLACVMEWGWKVARANLQKGRSKKLDSGMCDAACVAMFGMLHQKQTPRLFSHSMEGLMRQVGMS